MTCCRLSAGKHNTSNSFKFDVKYFIKRSIKYAYERLIDLGGHAALRRMANITLITSSISITFLSSFLSIIVSSMLMRD